MKTFLILEAIVIYQVFIIGFLIMSATEIINTIKKHKRENAKKNFDSLDKF